MISPYLGLLLLAIASGVSNANTCSDGQPESRNLPERIGRPESGIPEAYQLKCDTMEVRAGDTTRIFSNQKVHFGPASSDKKIILVRGTLIVEGTANFPTTFAGSLTEFAFGLKPGKAAWGGFRIAETGTLVLKNAMINNASIAIDSRSPNVRLERVYLKGCLHLVKPGNEFVKLDFTGTTIANLDFSPVTPMAAAPLPMEVEKDVPENADRGKGRNKPLIWSALSVATLGIAGTAIWLILSDDDGVANPPNPNLQSYPGDLGFPQTGLPRKP